ncbi:MAG: hypothetical protein JWM44_4226 [Bacilli bacterium]|nr:hypothetical protein [Bacilli bacterium]
MQIINRIINIVIIITFTTSLSLGYLVNAASNSDVFEPKPGWKGMSVGYLHSLAIKQDGTVWFWGKGTKLPTQVEGINDVISVAAGSHHSLALKKDGTVWVWGSNDEGQMGDGTIKKYEDGSSDEYMTINDRHIPKQVKGLIHISAISALDGYSFAYKDDGTVWLWGGGITIPLENKSLFNVTSILRSSDKSYSFYWLLRNDGLLWKPEETVSPDQQTHFTKIKQFAASDSSLFILKEDGTVWAWGDNSIGELGDGTYVYRKEPVQIDIKGVKTLSASPNGILYLKEDGTLWANGGNDAGELGIGSYEDKNIPVQIKGMTKIKSISTSIMGHRIMALKEDNTLWSWGNGFVGDGTEWYRTVPVMIKSYDSEVIQDINTIKVDLNGNELAFDQPPVLINNRTMVPLRKIFEALGATINWDQATSTVTATKGQIVVKLTIGSNVGYVNDKEVSLDAAAVVLNERTLVPVRFIGSSFGAKVTWDDITKSVVIKTE